MDNEENIMDKLLHPKTSLGEVELEDLKKKVLDSLSLIRQRVLTRFTFTGGILMRLELVPVRDFRVNTAQTDGTRIFFDIDFYKSLTEDERTFVLAHEAWHVIYMHFLRQQKRQSSLWNIATDCEINYMLRKNNFKSPEKLCYPPKEMEGKSAEEMYEYFLKKSKKNENFFEDMESSENGSGKGLTGQFDKHIKEGEQDEKIKSASLPCDSWGEKGIDKDYVPSINADIAERIREMVVSEAQRYERTKGSLPGCISSVINQIRKPEINWREYLAQFVTSCIGDRRVWLPPNRHHVWSGNYFQSRRGETVNVIVTVDTSGSTTADLPKFMGELIGLIETFGNYELTIIQCDCKVQDVSHYDSFNEFPTQSIKDFKWNGFGGSDLRPAFKEIQKMNTEATFHIVFTDGYITVPNKNPLNIPTLFVLTQDGVENLCDWGEKVKFKEQHEK